MEDVDVEHNSPLPGPVRKKKGKRHSRPKQEETNMTLKCIKYAPFLDLQGSYESCVYVGWKGFNYERTLSRDDDPFKFENITMAMPIETDLC